MTHQEQTIADSTTQNAINVRNEPTTPEFLDPLPFDIAIKVGAYLNQQDCLTCMAVCRSWYLTAPQYIQHAWRTVFPMFSDVRKYNRCWEMCVRDYARNIMFHDYNYSNLLVVMQKVIDCRCIQVNSLRMLFHTSIHEWRLTRRTELTVPNGIDGSETKEVVSLLKQLTGTTTNHLTLNDMSTTLNFSDILAMHPTLIKFSYRDCKSPPIWQPRQFTRTNAIQFTCLTELYLDAFMDTKLLLEPILQSTPNLQYLAYGQCRMKHPITPLGRSNTDNVVELDKVFSWCPNLTYLETNGDQKTWNYRHEWLAYIKQSRGIVSGLRSFRVCEVEGYGPKEIGGHILRNANALELLWITCYSVEWPSILSQLYTPLLRTLAVEVTTTISRQSMPWDIMLPECPSLEQLDLKGSEKNRVDLSTLKKLKRLRQLKLSYLTLQYDRSLFEDLAMQGSKITNVSLHKVITTNDILLESIGYLPSLTKLFISFRIDSNDSEDNLRRFAELLKQTSIQLLRLDDIDSLTASVLQPLGALPRLRTLNVSCNAPLPNFVVNASDLLELLNTSSPSLRIVFLGKARFTSIQEESIDSFLRQNVGGYRVTVIGNSADEAVKSVAIRKTT